METKDVSKLVLLSIQEGLSQQLSELSKYSFDGSSILIAEKQFFQNIGKSGTVGREKLFSENDELKKVITHRGKKHYFKFTATGKYLTLLGEIRVKRGIFQSNHDKNSICPLEEKLKFINDDVSFAAAEYICYSLASMTIREFVAHCRKWSLLKPSVSTVKRVVDYVGRFIKEHGLPDDIAEQEQVASEAVTLAISMDGTSINIKDEGWKHAGAATVSSYDAAGKRLTTIYIGRMPEKGKKTIKALLEAEVSAKLSHHNFKYVVCIADGAREFWRYFRAKYPDAIHVVDFFHVAEHLSKLSQLLFMNELDAKTWYEKYVNILKNAPHGAAKLIRAVRYRRSLIQKNNEIESELKYLQHNRHRMDYYSLIAKHLPIGSGVIEAACKNLIGARLKRSGMRWTYEGGETILTLRSLVLSKRWDAFWNYFLKSHFHNLGT
jgi:hypothetical protein